MKREDFCFHSFIFSFLSHRKHRTVKGGRGNTKENFSCDAQLKILHLPIPSSEAIGNLIQFSQISSVTETKFFWSLRNLFRLRSWEFASVDCLHSEEHDSPKEFDTQISDRCCAMGQLSQNIFST